MSYEGRPSVRNKDTRVRFYDAALSRKLREFTH